MDFKAALIKAIGPGANPDNYIQLRSFPFCRDSYENAYDRNLRLHKMESGWYQEAQIRKAFCDDIREAMPALERLENELMPEEKDLEKLQKFFVPGSEQHDAFTEDFKAFLMPEGIKRLKEFSQNVLLEEREFLINSFEKIIDNIVDFDIKGDAYYDVLFINLGYPNLVRSANGVGNLVHLMQEYMQQTPNPNKFKVHAIPQDSPILSCLENPFGTKTPQSTVLQWVENGSPLDQFEIRDFLSLDAPVLADLHISITNIALYLAIAAFTIYVVNLLARNYNKIVANSWSISLESIYATVHGIVINQINSNKGQVYFPFIYTLFIFILANNLMGMIPYGFAATSHFILAFYLSFTVVFGATILGLRKFGLGFFSFFVPGGCPLGLLPLLVLIEFISYLARNVSLGLRLAANVLSGHMLLNILSGFAYNIMNSGIIYLFMGLIPLAFIIAFSGLELGIAFIQAQVFVVLTCSYVKDALVLH